MVVTGPIGELITTVIVGRGNYLCFVLVPAHCLSLTL